MKIENVPMSRNSDNFRDFVRTLKELDVGQSFVVDELPANYRTAISCAQIILNKKLTTPKIREGFRVGCVAIKK